MANSREATYERADIERIAAVLERAGDQLKSVPVCKITTHTALQAAEMLRTFARSETPAGGTAKVPTYSEIAGAVARGWCSPNNAHKVMDTELAFAISVQIAALLGLGAAPSPDGE